MTTRREQIISKALEFLKSNPNGIRYSKLVNMIKDSLREIQVNTIHGTIWNLDVRIPNEVYKPSRGIFRHTSFKGADTDEITAEAETRGVSEEDFYEPFKKYVNNPQSEIGGISSLRGKAA